MRTGRERLGTADRVEAVDLDGDLRAILPRGERRHAPVGNREDDDARGLPARELDGPRDERLELGAILLDVTAAVLVVDAYQEAHERVGARWRGDLDAGGELVGRPARSRDDFRVADV